MTLLHELRPERNTVAAEGENGRGLHMNPTYQDRIHIEIKPRPRDSWVIWGSALGLMEEAVEFTAGGIEGALLLFRAVVDQWSAVGPNHITNELLGRDLS